ncbi:protein TolR [Rhodanobacter sp. A1T4]|uniref:protein TolR n=1 Tax=Rhodanobacter sp. A1T4 TaxID=2723087 RepID=UPI0016212138|nr:protein TolR [Rhodanobacter sp. A1T4]MBB6247123.1 biopolymer transport protein TolR [Rhodanobacter sp. A1T4]
MAISQRRKRYKLKSEINVVPYIDVMLVLLIIFMVTTPMMKSLGVPVQLPQSNAKSLKDIKDPVVISIDQNGQIFLKVGDGKADPVSVDEFTQKITAFQQADPDLQVILAGDKNAVYGKVYVILPILQQAGVTKIGLLSQPGSGGTNGRK